MGNLKMVEWNPDKVVALTVDGVKQLRENALRYGDSEVVSLCDADLERRSPRNKTVGRVKGDSPSRTGKSVIGFHFVCEREKGVAINSDGTFWSGTWVVDEKNAERGLKISSYVALHTTKSEPSYRQGVIIGWRKAARESEYAEGRPVKIESGIDFLVKPTDEPYNWIGEGSGEKGYNWGG